MSGCATKVDVNEQSFTPGGRGKISTGKSSWGRRTYKGCRGKNFFDHPQAPLGQKREEQIGLKERGWVARRERVGGTKDFSTGGFLFKKPVSKVGVEKEEGAALRKHGGD